MGTVSRIPMHPDKVRESIDLLVSSVAALKDVALSQAAMIDQLSVRMLALEKERDRLSRLIGS